LLDFSKIGFQFLLIFLFFFFWFGAWGLRLGAWPWALDSSLSLQLARFNVSGFGVRAEF
jgi:hypothetical protein